MVPIYGRVFCPRCGYFEDVLILIAQWFQPSLNIQEEDIRRALDQLAQRIQRQAEEQGTSPPGGPTRRYPAVDEPPALDIATCRGILDAANAVLRLEGYAGAEDYYAPQNSFINRVLETRRGIPITMSLLYSCVLARLGVVCEPVNFPSHFLLRWLEHPQATTDQGKVLVEELI